jgi:hypothetical protein
MNSISDMRLEINNLNDKIGWVDWLDKHKNWITNLSEIKDYKGRVEIINQYLDKVVVSFNKKKNNHSFKLRLKLPIYQDKMVKKGKKYSIDSGEYFTRGGYSYDQNKHRTTR